MFPARLSIASLCHSDTAVRQGIDNKPDAAQLINLGRVQQKLYECELLLGQPIFVSSGFRCAELNLAIGGSKTSDHCNGLAADWSCPDFGTPLEVCQRLVEVGLKDFDQLIYEGTWVHLGIGVRMREQLLTARFSRDAATGRKRTTYENGINP